MLLSLGIHYIHNKKNDYLKNIGAISYKNLSQALSQINNKYDFISPYNLKDYFSLTNVQKKNNKYCLITFDDGLRSQYDIGINLLESFNAKGIFFIVENILAKKKIPLTFLLHIILIYFDDKFILTKIISYLKIELNFNKLLEESTIYFYEKNNYRRILKYLVNYKLNSKQYSLLTTYFTELISNKINHPQEEWFFNVNECYKVLNSGHLIGNHGSSHMSYERLSLDYIINDIIDCHHFLEHNFNLNIYSYSHPQGGDFSNKNIFLKEYLKKLNYDFIFLFNNKFHYSFKDSNEISRLDINKFICDSYV